MQPKLTLQVRLVLTVFLRQGRDTELYGRQVCDLTGLPPGTIFPILARLEKARWMTSRWEDPSERKVCRQVRHYYCLTLEGRDIARQEAWDRSIA